jgi:class 3 adenylate cyclase
MSKAIHDPLAVAREAVERRDWERAVELFELTDASVTLGPEDLEAMAEAAWWSTRPDQAIEALERAYEAYLRAGKRARAGYVAVALSREYGAKLARSVARGWLNRAKELLESEPEGMERGYLYSRLSVQALNAGELDEAIELARRTVDIGDRVGDRDLRAAGLIYQGMALVERGDITDGLAMIDEAALAAVSGELGPFLTGSVYCNTISTCCSIADYRRAGEWAETAQRHGVRTTPGDCRIHQAEILVLRGAWLEAEEFALRGADELRRFNRLAHVGEALYQVGDIRRRMGDFTAAHDSFREASASGRDPQPALALLLLEEGNADAAMAAIDRALREAGSSRVERARFLPALVEISLEAGGVETARTAAEEMASIADAYDAPAFHAAAHVARGEILLTEGNVEEASRVLRRGVEHWQEVEAPYEAARARVRLGWALQAQGDIESARLEAHAARAVFERLDAVPAMKRADELLARLTLGTRSGSSDRAAKTFLFTDIVRSTNLVEAIGDEAWLDLLAWHDQTLRSLFAKHRGEEIDHAGDGFFVVFDEPALAIECAVAIQRTLAAHRRTHGFAPTVRIGLHTADATRSGKRFTGRGVHEAARIAALADGGEILASLATVTGASPTRPVSEARTVKLKGISNPIEVVSVRSR